MTRFILSILTAVMGLILVVSVVNAVPIQCQWGTGTPTPIDMDPDPPYSCTPANTDCEVELTGGELVFDSVGIGQSCWCRIRTTTSISFTHPGGECQCDIGYTSDPTMADVTMAGGSPLSIPGMSFGNCPSNVFFAIVASCTGDTGNCVLYSTTQRCVPGCP